MRERITTNNKEPVYTYVEHDWIYCQKCLKERGYHTRLLKIIERKGSIVSLQCKRCGGNQIETI